MTSTATAQSGAVRAPRYTLWSTLWSTPVGGAVAAQQRFHTCSELNGIVSPKLVGGSTSEPVAAPTHFLLYLNELTYAGEIGEALAQEVRDAQAAGLPIAMIHENDEARGGCEFGTFFQTTPQDLIESGLYRALALAFVSGDAHRRVSRALLAKAVGAEAATRTSASSQS